MFDAIIVGARCGGSPTAMLLAKRGYRVLLVDRARFPSDTMSTHWIWPTGVACLKRWGLLDRLASTNCPPFHTMGLDLGELRLAGDLPPTDGVAEICAPRRMLLDKLLLDAAAEAGAEIREAFTVTELIYSGESVTGVRGHGQTGTDVSEEARIVIGADGRNSLVAKSVGAAEYNVRPSLTCCYYAYWSDVPPHFTAIHMRPRRTIGSCPANYGTIASFPTNDGLTITPIVCPRDEFDSARSDPDRHIRESLALVDEFADIFSGAKRVEPVRGTGTLPNFFRTPYGNGWALVGDAGFHKDPILAQGISDAFRCAEWLTDAIDAGLSGARPLDDALADYQRIRDERLTPSYNLTCDLATLGPPPPEMLALYEALQDDELERNRFFGTLAGTVSIPEYYAPENLHRIIGGADRQLA